MMRNIIMDGDPGHDDVIAFLMALGNPSAIKVLGFTTVMGNSSVENCTNNILKIMDYLGVSVPVAAGYDSPLIVTPDPAAKYHGETGLDGALNYPGATSEPLSLHAVEFMKQTIEQIEGSVTLVTMGPLTNVAMLLKTYPEICESIEEIIMMGGSYGTGNALPKSEFNIYADPHAAKIVFDSGVPIVMATIEACFAGGILLKEQASLIHGGRVSKLVYDLLKFYSRYAITNGWDRTAIFDMTTIMYLLKPDIFTWRDMPVDIEVHGTLTRGMTVCDDRGPTYVKNPTNLKRVLLGVERDAVANIFFETLHRLDEQFQ